MGQREERLTSSRTHVVRASAALHLAFLVLVAVKSRWWGLGAAAVIVNHAALAVLSVMPRTSLLGDNLRDLHDSPLWKDRVALTFDDGPDPEVTPRVLDLLRRRGATASFFCVGDKVRRHPEIVQRMVKEGHGVENHTNAHSPAFAFFGPRRARQEMSDASKVIAVATGHKPGYFRTPAGMRNPWLAPIVASEGLRLVSWTRRAFDAVASDPERVVRRLTRDLAGGDILLLHDAFGPRLADGKPTILETLPRLLDELDLRALSGSRLPANQ